MEARALVEVRCESSKQERERTNFSKYTDSEAPVTLRTDSIREIAKGLSLPNNDDSFQLCTANVNHTYLVHVLGFSSKLPTTLLRIALVVGGIATASHSASGNQ